MSTAFQSVGFQSDAFQALAGLTSAPVVVPDVVGTDQASGTAELEAEGFSVVVVEVDSTQTKGTIVSQEPIGGSLALSGATVTISVSRGASKFYRKFKRKHAIWIGGVKYLGTQEDFELIVAQTFDATPVEEIPEIRLEMPKRDRFDEAAKELEREIKQGILAAQKRAYEMRDEEEAIKFLL